MLLQISFVVIPASHIGQLVPLSVQRGDPHSNQSVLFFIVNKQTNKQAGVQGGDLLSNQSAFSYKQTNEQTNKSARR